MRRRKGAVVTARDRELFALLARARWLSTTQIQRRFFAGKSANAVNKRMRKLVRAGVLRAARPGQMEEQFFRLATAARRLVQDESLIFPKTLPAHLSHFAAINDVRLWLEAQVRCEFWAESELKQIQHGWSVVPDAVAVLGPSGVVGIEVDRDTENASWFTSKLRRYRGMQAFTAVLVFAPGWPRLKALIKGLYGGDPRIEPPLLLADLNRLAGMSLASRAFIDVAALGDGDELPLVSVLDKLPSPDGLSCPRENPAGASRSAETGCGPRASRVSPTKEENA